VRVVNFEVKTPGGVTDWVTSRVKREAREVFADLKRRREPKRSLRKRAKQLRAERRRKLLEARSQRRQEAVKQRRKAEKRPKSAPPAHPAIIQAAREAA
jgi:hypothetical protein